MKPIRKLLLSQSGRLTFLALLLSLAGCAGQRMASGVSSFMPGNVTSSQWEPDVDYEAEQQASQKDK